MSLLYPRVNLRHLPVMLGLASMGALVAGTYGVVHDQITYTLSREYFTAFKFDQFTYLIEPGRPERVVVGMIGFLATWWVGMISAWFLARLTVPHLPARQATWLCMQGFGIIIGLAVVAGAVGALLGTWRMRHGELDEWAVLAAGHRLQHPDRFVRVAYIHNGSYLGGLIGLVLACISVRRQRGMVPEPDAGTPGRGAG